MNHFPGAALRWLVLSGLLGAGCVGTETGNPPRATLSLQLRANDAAGGSAGAESEGLDVTEVRVGLERIDVTACAAQIATPVAEGVSVDLSSDEGVFALPEGELCLVELYFEPRELNWEGVRPGARSELAVALAGETTGGLTFSVEDRHPRYVAFRPSNFLVGTDTELALLLDLSEALDSKDLEALVPNANGVVVVNDQENEDALTDFRLRWPSSWGLYDAGAAAGATPLAEGEAQ